MKSFEKQAAKVPSVSVVTSQSINIGTSDRGFLKRPVTEVFHILLALVHACFI